MLPLHHRAVSDGTLIPAKDILLPWGVKTLTGNAEIKLLNRLGHGISYSRLEEIDTALCLIKQAKEAASGIGLPSTSHPRVPAVLAFDNVDRLEETLSGDSTSHRVNGITVQPQVYTVRLPNQDLPSVKMKKHSVTPVQPEYNAGQRKGPAVMKPLDIDWKPAQKMANCKNLLWLLARFYDTDNQAISSWTGFNMQTRDNITVSKDTIGYLPTINAPATQLSTVHNVLVQTTKIKDELELKENASVLRTAGRNEQIDVVFDVYQETSIKAIERTLRGSETGLCFTNIISYYRIQQRQRLLSCEASKMKLVNFLVIKGKEPHIRKKLCEKVLYVTCSDLCFMISLD